MQAASRGNATSTLSHKVAPVLIHPTQFPQKLRRELLDSLRRRTINPKFHYESVKQATRWLKLHRAYSPSQRDKDCQHTYRRAFQSAVRRLTDRTIPKQLHVVGLGCGHGQKEADLLRLFSGNSRRLSFTPVDVSLPLVLMARAVALPFLAHSECLGLVCDLQTAGDLPEIMDLQTAPRAERLYTLFGVIPNSEPRRIFSRLAALVRPQDWLLLSANLAPGDDYQRGIERVLPGYDNPLTRDWLFALLSDLGIEPGDGAIRFKIEQDRLGLKRIAAEFHFAKSRKIEVDDLTFSFHRAESIGLFFSYRYTPALVRAQLCAHGLEMVDEWITASGEEGVFLCRAGRGSESAGRSVPLKTARAPVPRPSQSGSSARPAK